MRRFFIVLAMLVIALPAFSQSRNNYFRDQAALLDPSAYVFVSGTFWAPVTVPRGATWYLINAFYLWSDSTAPAGQASGSNYWFQRDPRPLLLPAGTVLQPNPDHTQFAYAYICEPELVTSSPRYRNAENLYYQRLDRLRSLPLFDLVVSAPAGLPLGTRLEGDFPSDFSSGIVVLASAQDVSWITLRYYNETAGLNLGLEVSDDHQLRHANSIMLPFRVSDFTGFGVRNATSSGVDDGESGIAGTGAIKYVKLPEDW